ncbi:acetylpolyamine amidohydrolase [Babesia caballi]|uniref:Acetylpolyamine amidohydrolase n=1 Tax=Babesia caballi TaxID=5871 RepID=A0AAV4LVU2_BABCB|nr:acetylpolyamine amidohydrolase [Babesia caballi]
MVAMELAGKVVTIVVFEEEGRNPCRKSMISCFESVSVVASRGFGDCFPSVAASVSAESFWPPIPPASPPREPPSDVAHRPNAACLVTHQRLLRDHELATHGCEDLEAEGKVVHGNQRHRKALASSARRPPHPVDEELGGVGEVEVNNAVDHGQVQSAGGQVGHYQNLGFAGSECCHLLRPRRHVHGSIYRRHRDPVRREQRSEELDVMLGGHKDDCPLFVFAQPEQLKQRRYLIFRARVDEPQLQLLVDLHVLVDLGDDRVPQAEIHELRQLRRQRRAHQQRLPFCRQHRKYAVNVG